MAFDYWYCPECETSYFWDSRHGDHCPDRLCKGRLENSAVKHDYAEEVDTGDLL